MVILFTIFLGAIVGILSTFLGLGGGIFFVTLLPILYEGIDHKIAIGTGLASVFLIVSLNTFQFNKKGLVCWNTVLKLAPSTLICAFLAGKLAHMIPNEILILCLTGILGYLSFRSFINKPKRKKPKSISVIWLNLLGVYAGGISGLTGIGSGAVTSTCFLNWNLLPNQKVSPTSNAVMVMTNLSGLLAYLNLQSMTFSWPLQVGYVRWDLALLLFASSLLTVFVGIRLQGRIAERTRSLLIAYILLILCIYEAFKFYELYRDI